jgi:4-amino-4-deoxy-L-arabinose transferase-like glycosyltransferase
MPTLLRVRVGGRRAIFSILVVGAALRVGVFLCARSSPQRFWSLDDRDYLAIATHLHAAYVAGTGRLFDVGLRRPPGYPLFVRGIFDVLGRHYADVIAVQLVLSVATIGVTYWLAGLFVPKRLALVAAAALAVDPASIVFANQLLTETLFALLVAGALGLLVVGLRRGSVPAVTASGLILGAAVLVRPVAEYLPLVIAIPLLAVAVTRRRTAVAVAAVAFVVGFAVPAGAWALRNYEQTGVATISTIDGHNMLQYRAVGALVESGVPRQLAQHDVLVRLAPHTYPGENAAKVSRAELSVGLSIVAEHPVGALESWLGGEGKLLAGPARFETAILLTGRGTVGSGWLRALVIADQVVTLATLLAAVAGIVGLVIGRIRLPELWVLAASAAYLVIVSGGPEAYSRFRVPVMPLLAVMGAAALTRARWRAGGRATPTP